MPPQRTGLKVTSTAAKEWNKHKIYTTAYVLPNMIKQTNPLGDGKNGKNKA